MNSKILYTYKNGNVFVEICEDGTRTIWSEDDKFKFQVPCNADIKISNQCFMNCSMCHENSSPIGKHAPLENLKFLESWGEGKECAIGGGSVTLHPQFIDILKMIKKNNQIVNCTFHETEFIENFELIKSLQEQGLIHGIGVSYSYESDKLIEYVNQLNHVVFHVIAGLVTAKELNYLSKNFNDPKLLILGFKRFRKGNELYEKIGKNIERKIKMLCTFLPFVFAKFNVVSFDNLALKQLGVKNLLSDKDWDLFYQGDDRMTGIYIDAVEGQFAANSTSTERFPIKDNMEEMYQTIQALIKEEK